MVFAEEEARRRGIGRVALNVFGGDEVARGLYRSLGYEENAVAMSKGAGLRYAVLSPTGQATPVPPMPQ
jgi:ribosomal protein S18 acetylase RimI-like enzyme